MKHSAGALLKVIKMGVSIYPVLNKEVPGFDVTEVSGKALADFMFENESLFAPLLRFLSNDEEELAGFIADQTGQDAKEIEVPAEEWFDPQEALPFVQRLLEQVRLIPQSVIKVPDRWEPKEFTEGVINDLVNLEKALVLAQQQQAQFHLAMDF